MDRPSSTQCTALVILPQCKLVLLAARGAPQIETGQPAEHEQHLADANEPSAHEHALSSLQPSGVASMQLAQHGSSGLVAHSVRAFGIQVPSGVAAN